MIGRIARRGPDGGGIWCDEAAGIFLGHRRLSIVDLTEAGSQPMASASGRYWITFNGEIYNFPALHAELKDLGVCFRGHCDTEVLLQAIEHWGLPEALGRISGMFAFALWDRRSRKLHLVRDRLGEKPLYVGYCGGAWVFASELKAFRPYPDFEPLIELESVNSFLRHGYVPAPQSIYRQVRKLAPGCCLTLDASARIPEEWPPLYEYWSLSAAMRNGKRQPFRGDADEAIRQLEELLRSATRRQMVADVPLGALLSGGIDSSTIVALMQAQSSRPIKTFAIGFSEPDYNEARHAKAVAAHLRTDHVELYVSLPEARSTISSLAEIYDEPFGDSSQIPTILAARLARAHVKVCLSGDGGDELFLGYQRYFDTAHRWLRLQAWPLSLRRILSRIALMPPAASWDLAGGLIARTLSLVTRRVQTGTGLRRGARLLGASTLPEFYRRSISHTVEADALLAPEITGRGAPSPWNDQLPKGASDKELFAYLDAATYLPDDILVKVDRATMAQGLEGRIPLLDHQIVEFAYSLPEEMKVREGKGKWILRRILEKYVPPELTERPKMGFGIPIAEWLRGPLRSWADDVLQQDIIQTSGLFQPWQVRRLWRNQSDRSSANPHLMWNVLMFAAWNAVNPSRL